MLRHKHAEFVEALAFHRHNFLKPALKTGWSGGHWPAIKFSLRLPSEYSIYPKLCGAFKNVQVVERYKPKTWRKNCSVKGLFSSSAAYGALCIGISL